MNNEIHVYLNKLQQETNKETTPYFFIAVWDELVKPVQEHIWEQICDNVIVKSLDKMNKG